MRQSLATVAKMLRPWVILILGSLDLANARILLVQTDGTDTGDCSSACESLGYAVSQSASGDTVLLGSGVHTAAGNRDVDPGRLGKAGLVIRGSGRESTVIDLGGVGAGPRLSTSAGMTVLEDFTLHNGTCDHLPSGERHGAALSFEGSNAKVRRLGIRHMRCTSQQVVFGGDFSGAALFLKDSTAELEDLVVTDCVANHGSGAACWGADNSKIYRSLFARHIGRMWGGTMLADAQSRTEFYDCTFSDGTSPYGGHLDDGGTASPLYVNCIFEYGHGTAHGGHFYAYARATSRFYNCVFQHGTSASSAGAAYLNGDTLPTFQNITFYNNSAATEAGAIRSLIFNLEKYLIINQSRFIGNSASDTTIIGAVTANSNLMMLDCVFEDNTVLEGIAGALSLNNVPSLPTILRRIRFSRNRAGQGAAIAFANAAVVDTSAVQEVDMEDCIFEDNEASSDAGAILLRGSVNLKMRNISFYRNQAGRHGGAIYIENRDQRSLPITLEANHTHFEGNSAASSGGALSCKDPLMSSRTIMTWRQGLFQTSRTYGSGGAIHTDCKQMRLYNVTLRDNEAQEGNGGAIEFGSQVECSKDEAVFEEVVVVGNRAQQTGGALFFDHPDPSCAIPGSGSTWNQSVPGPWWWADYASSVYGNSAPYGALQGTSPVRLQLTCGDDLPGRCEVNATAIPTMAEIHTYPGLDLLLRVRLLDTFGQSSADPTLWIGLVTVEASDQWHMLGIDRYRFDDGVSVINDVRFVQNQSASSSSPVRANLRLRLPLSFSHLRHVDAISIAVVLGNNGRQCPEGYVLQPDSRPGFDTCRPCPGGSYAIGGSVCANCRVGRYANMSGSTECKPCPIGAGCPLGTTQPARCREGSFQDKEEQESCDRCDVGRYQPEEGKDTCIPCAVGMETRLRGARVVEECVCQENSWYSNGTMQCEPCTTGMICPTGSTKPSQEEGYFVLETVKDQATTYEAYRCLPNHCPEGEANTCSPGRTGLACTSCKTLHYSCSSGHCCQCESGDILPFVVGVAIVLSLFGGLVMFTRTDMSSQRLTTLTVISTASQMLVLLQLLALLEGLQLPWSRPLSDIMQALSLMRFDLEMLRTRCIFSTQSMFTIYLIKLGTFPSMLLLLLLIFLVSACLGKSKKSSNDIVNCLGTVSMIAFLPATLTSLEPFMCVANPSDNSAVRSMPAVICGSGTHTGIVVLGACGILFFTLFIICGVLLVCMFYPQLMATGSGPVLVRRFRFLFQRFKPQCHRYAFTYLLRSLCCSLVPVIIPSSSTLQLLVLGVTAAVFGGIQCWQQPWRTWLANIVDALQNVAFQMLLLAAAGTLGGNVDQVQSELAILCTIMLILVLVVMISVCLWTALRSCGAKAKPYAAFLSHHKAGAACLARLMKCVITQGTGLGVFLDSDDLIDLDTLFETVQCDVSNVIVILTEQTLRRPWCAGELVMAYKYQVPLHCLTFDGYSGLSPDALANLDKLWTPEETHHLTALGITLADVKTAYQHLASLSSVKLPSKFEATTDLELVNTAVVELMKSCGIAFASRSSLRAALELSGEGSQTSVAVLVDMDGTESVAAAGVMRMLLAKEVPWNIAICGEGKDLQVVKDNLREPLGGMLVILGRRCLLSKTFASTFLHAKSLFPEAPVMTVLVDAGFQFPTKHQLDQEIVPYVASQLSVPVEKLSVYYHALMKILAMPLSLHLSQETLNTETHNIIRRLRVFQAGYDSNVQQEKSGRFVASLRKLTGTNTRVDKRRSIDSQSSASNDDPEEVSEEAGGKEPEQWVPGVEEELCLDEAPVAPPTHAEPPVLAGLAQPQGDMIVDKEGRKVAYL